MHEWHPADVIALIVVVTCSVLLYRGMDHIVATALLGIVVCYFGIDLSGITKKGRGKGGK
jgi:hypothetical protein